jgi:hypothetical protein
MCLLMCASKGFQYGLQNLPILLESQEMSPWRHHSAAFDSAPDMFCLHTYLYEKFILETNVLK